MVQPQTLGRQQIVRHLDDGRRQGMDREEADAVALVDRVIDPVYLFKPLWAAEQAHGPYLNRHVFAF